jgi:hypothetical protein
MFLVLSLAVFGVSWVVTMLYVRAAHGLVSRLRSDHPEFWREALGAPRFVAHHRRVGWEFQYRFYLQPLRPFLRWLLAGSPVGLSEEIRRRHRTTRRLLLASGLGLLLTFGAFALLTGLPQALRFTR